MGMIARAEGQGIGRRAGASSRWLVSVGAAALAASGLVLADTSCSLIVDTNGNQCDPSTVSKDCGVFPGLRNCTQNVCTLVATAPTCTKKDDCAGFVNGDCVGGVCARTCTGNSDCGGGTCTSGVCSSGPATGCTKNADCSGMGDYFVCRKSSCVSLTSDLCTTVYATKTPAKTAYQDDNAIIFGSILPTAANADGPYGHLVEDSIKLALDDFGKVDGLPGLSGGANRPLVLVGCNDGVNEDKTDDAAKHLINDLDVPAIIGYAFSGNTLQVAQDVTIPSGTLLFSPSATSAQITGLHSKDNGLVWRTVPSDDVQAQVLTLYYPYVESMAMANYASITAGNVKVAIVNHSDAYGSGLGDTLEGALMFNGKSATSQSGTNYKRVNYGASTAPDLSKVQDIINFAPNVIFLFGFNEGPDQIFTSVEKGWASSSYKPYWVFSDGGEINSLWASTTNPAAPADITTDDQRQRVSGTVPGVNATSWAPYGTFLTEFSASSYSTDGSADQIGPAGAYDILFLLAYSTVMVDKNPLTGANLVKYGLSQMKKSGGQSVQINRNNILSTLPQLTAGAGVNVTGVSGPLLFDGKGDVTKADIQIWCVPPSGGGKDIGNPATNSGFYYDSTKGMMTGCSNLATTCSFTKGPASSVCP